MEKRDVLVKGVPSAIFDTFRGFCSMEGKTEDQGMIDIIIRHIEEQSNGGTDHFKTLVKEYRKGA
jgi:hypothetical protein